MKAYFSKDYEESRQKFRVLINKIKQKWPDANLTTTPIGNDNDNTIDTIFAGGTGSSDQVIFFTSGEHGIEGYAGAAVIHLFVEECLDNIDATNTGICLVHALNPWGMRNYRRVTENNVDLNRNAFYDPGSVSRDTNKHYRKANKLFNPDGKLKSIWKAKAIIFLQLLKSMLLIGPGGIQKAKRLGQFEFDNGVYYGSINEEESTAYNKKLQRMLLKRFNRVMHLDWHSGLGPANEVTLVVPEYEPMTEDEIRKNFNLTNVMKFSEEEVKGDSTTHFYKLKINEHYDKYLFSVLCEFGTYGTGSKVFLRELKTMVTENQLHCYGTENIKCEQWVQDEFMALFYPENEQWRKAILDEARKVINNILSKEGFLAN